MAKYIQDKKTGKLAGTIGDGKTQVPTPATSLPKLSNPPVEIRKRLLSNPGRVGPAQTDFMYKGYELTSASNEDNKTIYIEIHSYTDATGHKTALNEVLELTSFQPEEVPDSFEKLKAETIAYIESEPGSEEWLADEFRMGLEHLGEYIPRRRLGLPGRPYL